MTKELITLILILCHLLLGAQTRSLKNFIEIDHEEHTRIVTSGPNQVFVENAQNIVIELSGATGLRKNNSEPHISSASALVHIKNGKAQIPQIRIYSWPRDYYRCINRVFTIESYTEESFVQIRSACNEVYFDRFFLKHATSSPFVSPQQKIYLSETNILHQQILKYGDEAYALLVETPEVKASGEVNEGGLGSDTVLLARLDFDKETFDTLAFFHLPAQPYQNINSFFGEAKINEDFSKIYLKTNDTLYTFNLGNLNPEIKEIKPNQSFGLEDRSFFKYLGYNSDSTYYKNVYQVNYRFNNGSPLYDSTLINLPVEKFSAENSLNIFYLDSSHLLFSETAFMDNKHLHLGITLADTSGKVIWQKQITPDYNGLILSDVQYENDTIVLSGYYKPGRFVLNRETSRVEFFPYGSQITVCMRILMDGTNLDAEELSKSEELVVFPNPFIVDFKIAELGISKYQIIDLNGVLVAEEKLDSRIGIYRVYQPALAYGLYILRLYKDNGEILEKKIFKLNSGY